MTPVVIVLCSVPVFLALPLLAVALRGWSAATRPIYGACLAICLVIFVVALAQLASMFLSTFIQRQIGSTRVLMGISPGRVAVSGEIEFWQIC